jgi:cell division transport system permease protein
MELVGATAAYIERPFIWVGLFQGVVGALIAVSLIHLSLMIVDRYRYLCPIFCRICV